MAILIKNNITKKTLLSHPFMVFALLGLVIGLIYTNALNNDFVFDDYELVVENSQIRSFTNIPEILGFDDHKRRYRPIRFISYTLDYYLFGLEAYGFHLINVIYHWFCSILVYLISRKLTNNCRIALLTALVFAVHPVQTDAVTYISGRRDVLCTLFYLLGFLAFLRYRSTQQLLFFFVFLVSAVLGVWTKEMAVTLPLMCLAYDWYAAYPVEGSETGRDRPFSSAFLTLKYVISCHAWFYGLIFLLALLFVIEKVVVNNPSQMEGLYGANYGLHILTVARVLVTYLKLMCFPLTLTADYSFNAFPVTTSLADFDAIVAVLVLAVIVYDLYWVLPRNKLVTFAGIWFFIALLPVMHIVPHHELLAEHYLYLPSVGFCLLVGIGVESARLRLTPSYIAYGSIACVLILFAARTVIRNFDWRDDLTLWRQTVQTTPGNARAHTNLGVIYARQDHLDQAFSHFKKALEIDPHNIQALNKLGMAYYVKGEFEQARDLFVRATQLKPAFARAQFNLGRVCGQFGDLRCVIEAFGAAIDARPNFARAHHELATGYYKSGILKKAQDSYAKALSIDPSYLPTYRNLSIIYQKLGKPRKAIEVLQRSLKVSPDQVEINLRLAQLYLSNGYRRQLAVIHLNKVLQMEPNHSSAQRILEFIQSLSER